MAAFSMKKGGKEVGSAKVYAPPHQGSKPYSAQQALAETESGGAPSDMNVSVGNVSRKAQPGVKTSGIQMRGAGAATKGKMSRGPMG